MSSMKSVNRCCSNIGQEAQQPSKPYKKKCTMVLSSQLAMQTLSLSNMAGKLQSVAFIVMILSCSWLNIPHGMARPLVLPGNEGANMVVKSLILDDHGHKNDDRKVEIQGGGPSHRGRGHHGRPPPFSSHQLNN
ncbi:hypothetical protein RJT34_25379 [Clitoria ternatea]|uniref:Uncharacterized protein n=1 Tax=Clitoria ternatea TaxID=43366 RepID=A0AAN9ILF2_CLITE